MLRHITKVASRTPSLLLSPSLSRYGRRQTIWNGPLCFKNGNNGNVARWYSTNPPSSESSTPTPSPTPTPTPTPGDKPTTTTAADASKATTQQPTPTATSPENKNKTTTSTTSTTSSTSKQQGSAGKQEQPKSGSAARTVAYLGFVIAALLTGGIVYKWQTDPLFVKKLEDWGVLSMIESVKGKAEASLPSFRSINVPKEKEAVAKDPVAEPVREAAVSEQEVVQVETEEVPLPEDPVPVEIVAVVAEEPVAEPVPVLSEPDPVSTPDLSIVVVPLTPSSEVEAVEITPTEIVPVDVIIVANPDEAPVAEVSEPASELLIPTELAEVFSDKPTSSHTTIDFQELLKEQAAQVEALKEKMQQILSEQHQELDHKAQAHESAYREVLAMHDRIHRRELAEKLAEAQAQADQVLAQVSAELKAQYELQLQNERNAIQAQFQQQFEQNKAELQQSMEESLKNAVENAQAQFSVRLAEEINKFDSKLVSELANEEAKYSASHSDRMKAVDKLRAEVTLMETALYQNQSRLKTSNNLHSVSAAVFDLGTTLASPTRVSFVNELEKLETASKALGDDPVVHTVADVLRPIAAGGIAPYNELTERFKTVVASGRQAALVPEGGGMMGNLVAAVASKLIIPAKGPVPGDTPEAIFAKAEYYLENGELHEAVNQLSQLRGMPASIVRDWLQAASDRLVVENAVKALHSHVVVLAHQQSSGSN